MRGSQSIWVVLWFAVAGCMAEIGGEEPEEPDLDPARMSVNRMSVNLLSTAALTAANLDALAAGNVAALASGSGELLHYAALCALPDGGGINVAGTYYGGRFGFAPKWPLMPLSADQREWMTACLEAHANALGIAVPFSARGAHPNLMYAGLYEQRLYSIHEGAFFGNVFDPPARPKISCEGDAVLGGVVGGWMMARMCGRAATVCEFVSAGACRKGTTRSCELTQIDGGDVACHNPASSSPATSGTHPYRAVTSYLRYEDYKLLWCIMRGSCLLPDPSACEGGTWVLNAGKLQCLKSCRSIDLVINPESFALSCPARPLPPEGMADLAYYRGSISDSDRAGESDSDYEGRW